MYHLEWQQNIEIVTKQKTHMYTQTHTALTHHTHTLQSLDIT